MTPAILSIIWSSVASRRLATHPDLSLPVLLCPIRSARRMRLRFDDRERLLKLTHPKGIAQSAALDWAATQKVWIDRQLQSTLPAEPLIPGTVIPVNGRDVELTWSPDSQRTARFDGDRLICGGPESGFERRIERFLKRLALESLSDETAEISKAAGLRACSVAIGDARSRWGSCSSSGRIRFNWRLILAAPDVRRYVVAHEVAHLRHLDHGPKFKAFERILFGGDVAGAKALLRSSGPRLHRIGRNR